MKRITSLYWKAFYKLKFGKEYQVRMTNAARLCSTINQSSVGNLSSFYDAQGNQIRGWHKASTKFKDNVKQKHPLEIKYGH